MAGDNADMDVDGPITAPPARTIPSNSMDAPRASSVPLRPPEYTVGYIFSTEMTSHFSPHGHPEDPERITRIYQALTIGRHTKKMKWIPIRTVHKEEALLVHSEDHWDKVAAIQSKFYTERTRIFLTVSF